VVFFLATIVVAVLVVAVTKGSFQRIGRIHLNALWLLLVALIIQVALELVDFPAQRIDDVGLAILLTSYVLIFAFCFLNRHTGGMVIIAIGVALNVLAIALNGGMPTKDEVQRRNGRDVHVPIERTVKHKPRESDDKLPFLGDVITAPGVPNQQFSVGDIVIGIGVVDICFEASRRPRRRGDYLPEADWTATP
jgi:chromate transport protein ChrA